MCGKLACTESGQQRKRKRRQKRSEKVILYILSSIHGLSYEEGRYRERHKNGRNPGRRPELLCPMDPIQIILLFFIIMANDHAGAALPMPRLYIL